MRSEFWGDTLVSTSHLYPQKAPHDNFNFSFLRHVPFTTIFLQSARFIKDIVHTFMFKWEASIPESRNENWYDVVVLGRESLSEVYIRGHRYGLSDGVRCRESINLDLKTDHPAFSQSYLTGRLSYVRVQEYEKLIIKVPLAQTFNLESFLFNISTRDTQKERRRIFS